MNIIYIIFSLLVTTECKLFDINRKCRQEKDDVFTIINNSTTHSEFWTSEMAWYTDHRDTYTIRIANVIYAMEKVYQTLTLLYDKYLNSIERYTVKLFKSYCSISRKLIELSDNVTYKNVYNTISTNNHAFCVNSFLFRSGQNNYDIEHLSSFLQTMNRVIRNDSVDIISRDELLKMFTKFNNNFYINYDYTTVTTEISSDKANFDSLIKNLKEIKGKIEHFSNLFCSPNILPFINTELLLDNKTSKKNDFIHYMFNTETCFIYVQKDVPESQISTEKNQIYKWDCSKILSAPKYGLNYYTTENLKSMRLGERVGKSKSVLWKNPIAQTIEENKSMTLTSLKQFYKSNNHFYSLMRYYPIALEYVVFVSIKEGDKILQAIKNRFSKIRCTNNMPMSINEINEMRLLLFMYKLFIYGLMEIIIEKFQPMVREKLESDDFNLSKIDIILKLLENPPQDNSLKQFLKNTCKSLILIFSDMNIDDCGGNHKDLIFKEFYLMNPLLNIRVLYNINVSYLY